jgi:ferredoxin-type protein NapF
MKSDNRPSGFDPSRRAFLRGRPLPQPISVTASCLAKRGVICRTCEEACDAGAVSFALRAGAVAVPRIDLDKCTRCGDCVPACPTAAIVVAAPTERDHAV